MADFIDSVKSKVSAAVSRTSWEAQKQLRVRGKQTEIDKLLEQREKLLNDLAQVAIDLYQKSSLTDPHLSRICASIQELEHDVQNRESQLLEIKKEAYPAQQLAPAPMADYTPPPVPTYVPPTGSQPGAQAPANQSKVQGAICPSCGNTVRPNALYCRNCGAKLR
ncbi:MAG TPA: zinc ribbon domain-containing protein [Ktedonobacteraceae bacterium]|nr:zinc ribbon domain-containing protein [Ktedonobacteraceae bacterium]